MHKWDRYKKEKIMKILPDKENTGFNVTSITKFFGTHSSNLPSYAARQAIQIADSWGVAVCAFYGVATSTAHPFKGPEAD